MTDHFELSRETVIALVHVSIPDLQKDEKSPEISNYAIEAHVRGDFARIKTTFTIHNENARAFEGELEFPLPEDGAVCGYAIDIGGEMIPAAAVEKEKARIAFENEVKKGIDPGIAEHIRGNAYRTRIYPIPANGSRTVCIEYVSPLVHGMQGEAALYIPMPKKKLVSRDIIITADMPETAKPKLHGLGDQRFAFAEARWHVESHETETVPDDDLIIAVPELPNILTSVEKCGNDTFFAMSFAIADTEKREAKMPQKWRILWDASGSRSENDIHAARAVIDRLPDDASYELIVFRNDAERARTFASRHELADALDNTVCDGGTNYGVFKSLEFLEKFDGKTLFFTDGLDTFDGTVPSFGADSAAIISGKARDTAVLRQACGGCVLDLSLLSPDDILAQILVPPPVLSDVSGNGIDNVQGLGLPAVGRVCVIGRLKANHANIQAVLSDDRTFSAEIHQESAKSGNTLAAAWAARRIASLSPNPDTHREELIALGRRFSIVSPVTSMIVFERIEQWIQYDIEPPKTLQSLHQKWLKNRRNAENIKQNETEQHKSEVQSLWKERIAWWKNPVPQIQSPKSGLFGNHSAHVPVHESVRPSESAQPSAGTRLLSGIQNMISTVRPPHLLGTGSANACRCAPMNMPNEDTSANAMPYEDNEAACLCCDASAAPDNVKNCENPSSAAHNPVGKITVQAWDPNVPYLQAIKDAQKVFGNADAAYAEYLRQRRQYASSPSFFLDCAGYFIKEKQTALSMRILSNLSEIQIDDPALLRVYAWRLREAGEFDCAIRILRKVAKLRPDESLSWRDLALTLTLRAKKNLSADDAQEALEFFKKSAFMVCKRSDTYDTAVIALEEFNALAAWCRLQNWPNHAPAIPQMDEIFLQNLDMDLRIVLMWDADNTDIDLHVLEPSGEEVYYQNRRSHSGAFLSRDVTAGYGPEEYLHKKANPGDYQILSNYYASHQQKLTGPVTVTAAVFTNWGRPNEDAQTLTLRLEKAKDHVTIGTVNIH